jgi:hypothetical protein
MKRKLYKDYGLSVCMESKQIKSKKTEKVVYYASCKFCNRYMESIHLSQLSWNLKIHESQCNENPKKEELADKIFNEVRVKK